VALHKETIQSNGIPTKYHRIVYIRLTTNKQNSIAVSSYVNEDTRISEKNGNTTPYRAAATYETDYDPTMTIEAAYNYLKTLPEFEGAEDV
jgi:hypothetical protein